MGYALIAIIYQILAIIIAYYIAVGGSFFNKSLRLGNTKKDNMVDQYQSDIPTAIHEVVISEFREEDGCYWYKTTECILDGEVVGKRFYDNLENLMHEEPLKNGKRHGLVYTWDETGNLTSCEPYKNGMPHGVAKQFDESGKIIGTYELNNGTGYDIWRNMREDGSIYISEIHSMKNGKKHGFELWLNEDQETIWEEKTWLNNMLHGPDYQWELNGKLRDGYPKYWVKGKEVSKAEYLSKVKTGSRLSPVFESNIICKRN
jgi:hypothetical protein